MPSSYSRSAGAAVCAFVVSAFLFVHADTTTPTAAQLLLQALASPNQVIPYSSPTQASTSPTGVPQMPAGIASLFLLTSLPSLIPLNANLVPQEAIVPGASPVAATPPTGPALMTVSASSTATLIATLYAEVQALEAQLATLEATSPAPTCAPLAFARALDLGSTGSDVSALQQFLKSKGYYTYPSITGYFGPVTEKAGTWTTDEPSSSKIVYGTTSSYGSATSSATLVTSHSIVITGLTASTTYHYAIVSTDNAAHTSTSTDETFTTTAGGQAYSGPGDVVSAADAWWGLRAFSAATAGGKAVNICRASDSTCEDINTLTNGNLDTATAASFCVSTTCTAHTLYDQTGNGYNLTQATVANQPTLTFNCLGSLPCLTVNATQWMSNSTLAQAQPLTVVQATEVTALQSSFSSYWDSAVTIGAETGRTGTGNVFRLDCGTILAAAANDNVWHALQGICNGSSSDARVDATDNTGSTGTTGMTGIFTLFSDGFHGSDGYTGNWVETGVWGSGFNGTQLTNMNSNQHTYWGF